MISTREPIPVELRDVGWCLNKQSHAILGRADHQHLFSPSVGVWVKIHLYCRYRSDHFFPPAAAVNVLSVTMRFQCIYIHRIICLSKHSRINCDKPILQSRWRRCSINMILLVVKVVPSKYIGSPPVDRAQLHSVAKKYMHPEEIELHSRNLVCM
ncbi:hypothetical protein TNCV_1523241 [Trichonephila clavipes]|nr:hypothetical protein TNCV_1523241 [Trichonephila clavipes]